MGKRSDFKRRPQDAYYTPYSAVVPLLPFLDPNTKFAEPCCGDGRLIRHLESNGHFCEFGDDIAMGADAFDLDFCPSDIWITNPPWTRNILHPMILHLIKYAPAWLLFDADWMHTKQAIPYLDFCTDIVSIGRVSWMENGTSGKDNCCWYHFSPQQDRLIKQPFFHQRQR